MVGVFGNNKLISAIMTQEYIYQISWEDIYLAIYEHQFYSVSTLVKGVSLG